MIRYLAASGIGIFSAVMTSTALSLAAFALAIASAMLPDLNASEASVQLWFSVARSAFAPSSFSLSRPAGSYLLCERMSTRLLMASAILGRPPLMSSQAFVSSAFLAVAAAATSLALAATSCALASAAL